METMSPQQQINISQSRSSSLTEDAKMENRRRIKALSYRRQSAPSLVISKALTRSRTMSRENCLSPVSPETCLLVQSYMAPSRMFISHAYAQLKTGLQTQERHMFLFTDILLISKAKSSTNFKLKAQARVCEMWIANCMEEVYEGSTSPEKSFVMGWPTCNCVATFSSVEQKEKWLSLMKSRIKEEKEKDHPKTIPLKVHAKDLGNFSHKTIAVSNTDSANEVTRLALQQFGIVGCVKDYQLWVSSRKDNAPYPLIGHEFPFSIQMSHIREPLGQTGDKSDAVSPPDKDVEFLFDQLQSDSQCQFILKPSRVAVGHSFVVDPDQKPFKRRRSLINWAFWRGSTTQLDDSPPSPLLPTTGRLFGLPLSVVCMENSLPRPIMDMLVFLFQEGPFTRGIFRRSAGAKACRELRDILDSGIQDIQLTRQSIFVIAAVFKDFLRSIPGSLLLSEFYEKWMATMDMSDEADDNQLKAIQSLVASLPPENILLLKHVLAVLYSIQLRAQDNQMNAFNLAVCIAPSMLSSPAPSSPEMEGEGAKKVCDLARLMIENCKAVMGEDVTTLFDGFPQRCSIDGHGSDVSSYQMTDSSYDSLENELNDDSGSPFQPMQRSRGKPDSRSCDSVLTLSDCDLDQPETDPDNTLSTHLLLPPLTHPVKTSPAVSPSSPRPHSPCEVPVLSQGIRQLRRCSEPAIWNATSSLSKYLEQRGNRKGSYDGATSQGKSDAAEMFAKHLKNLRLDKQDSSSQRGQSERVVPRRRKEQLKPPPLHLDASCSSLYSPAASPTRSSMSSLDSAFSQHSADFAKPCSQPVGSFKAIVSSSPRSPGIVSTPSPGPTLPSPKESPPKEKFDWSQLRSSHGLHPNTWLKKDHRLSLSKDRIGLEDEETGDPHLQSEVSSKMGHSKEKRGQESSISTSMKGSNSPPSYEEAMLQTQHSRSVYYPASEKPLTVKELRELHNQACSVRKTTRCFQKSTYNPTAGENSNLPKSLFYGQSGRCLAMHRQKSYSLIPVEEKSNGCPSSQRRASEPGGTCLGLDREAAKNLEHLHRQAIGRQDGSSLSHPHGLKVSDVEPHDKASEPRFCLSPAATKAVRDYFSFHGGEDPQSNLKKSQEVALAVVHGKREWMRRCSDPRLEDFEKMLFAEESYV
ncbi:rho GTPase-activating protein 20-like isoform X2 [Colossoma macropomum]|uniref:rho GTPase-activating protein 20-like isoform X2 n=1 Tax=Colossoma macropomum TaxID=42526 RepID=UPI001864E1D3|nr:rho GTPase-activating protein 20-like isoform X2 [Colossoma macropomum]